MGVGEKPLPGSRAFRREDPAPCPLMARMGARLRWMSRALAGVRHVSVRPGGQWRHPATGVWMSPGTGTIDRPSRSGSSVKGSGEPWGGIATVALWRGQVKEYIGGF